MKTNDDYVSRKAVIEKLCEYGIGWGDARVKGVINSILPTDVRPVVRGKWETALLDHEAFGVRPKVLYCSECHTVIAYKTNFCPNCGADMREVE